MALIVQKFGGTSVADTQRIRNVANRTLKTHDQGNDVVVILSAMAGVTDHLIGLANEATSTPDRENWMCCWPPANKPPLRCWP
jgi:aspartate kinase